MMAGWWFIRERGTTEGESNLDVKWICFVLLRLIPDRLFLIDCVGRIQTYCFS